MEGNNILQNTNSINTNVTVLSNFNHSLIKTLYDTDIEETESSNTYIYKRNNEEIGYIDYIDSNQAQTTHIDKIVTINQRYSDHYAIDPKNYDVDKFDSNSLKLGDIKMKGLGTRMLKKFLEKSKKRGMVGVTLIYNHSSMPFYEKICERFRESNVIKGYTNLMNTITFMF